MRGNLTGGRGNPLDVRPIQLDLSDVEIVDEVIALDEGDIAWLEPRRRARLPAPRRAARTEGSVRRPASAWVSPRRAFYDEPTRVYALRHAARTECGSR
jgi:hypothetical protein